MRRKKGVFSCSPASHRPVDPPVGLAPELLAMSCHKPRTSSGRSGVVAQTMEKRKGTPWRSSCFSISPNWARRWRARGICTIDESAGLDSRHSPVPRGRGGSVLPRLLQENTTPVASSRGNIKTTTATTWNGQPSSPRRLRATPPHLTASRRLVAEQRSLHQHTRRRQTRSTIRY